MLYTEVSKNLENCSVKLKASYLNIHRFILMSVSPLIGIVCLYTSDLGSYTLHSFQSAAGVKKKVHRGKYIFCGCLVSCWSRVFDRRCSSDNPFV